MFMPEHEIVEVADFIGRVIHPSLGSNVDE